MVRTWLKITHRPSGETLAEGPKGWGITPFEGNLYIGRKYLLTKGFRPNFIPGFCPYKFFYVLMDLHIDGGGRARSLGWLYWLPNPLLPFIWYRVAVASSHPDLEIEEYARETRGERSVWRKRTAAGVIHDDR